MRIWMPVVAASAALLANSESKAEAAAMQQTPTPTFDSEVKFLGQHADAVVLTALGAGPIVVSPKLTGRVMTSAFAKNEAGFGLVNRAAIEEPPVERGFSNYGGEDRLWLAPEGGPYGLFFDAGAKQALDNWYVPPVMDGGPRTVTAQDASSITFRDRVALTNVKSVKFELAIERRIEALTRAQVGELVGRELPESVHLVAFRSTNTVENKSATPLPADGVIAPWILGQFNPSATNEVLMPFHGSADTVKKDYFGVVPAERLKFVSVVGSDRGVARFKADAQLRSKIGVSAKGATGWLGAYDPTRGVLTLVRHTLPAADALVPDCNWIDPNPRATQGDVATSYNHGLEPRFFELESIGAALPAKAGGSVTHVQTTIHLGGDPAVLAELASKLLNAAL